MVAYEQIPLVGPGSELQLTLDGRAVPHMDVVRARSAVREPNADDAVLGCEQASPSADGQITL